MAIINPENAGTGGGTGEIFDSFQQDIYIWEGSASIANGVFQNYFSLNGISKQSGGTADTLIGGGGVIMFPPYLKPSQVVISIRISGTVGGTAGLAREWLTQIRRPDSATIVGSTESIKLAGNDITNKDTILVSFTSGPYDPFTVHGVLVGLSNISTQPITLTSVSVRIQRIVNKDPVS